MNTKLLQRCLVAFVALSVVTACGRAGAPYKTSEAAAKQAKENGEPVPAAAPEEDKRFILDGLLN